MWHGRQHTARFGCLERSRVVLKLPSLIVSLSQWQALEAEVYFGGGLRSGSHLNCVIFLGNFLLAHRETWIKSVRNGRLNRIWQVEGFAPARRGWAGPALPVLAASGGSAPVVVIAPMWRHQFKLCVCVCVFGYWIWPWSQLCRKFGCRARLNCRGSVCPQKPLTSPDGLLENKLSVEQIDSGAVRMATERKSQRWGSWLRDVCRRGQPIAINLL